MVGLQLIGTISDDGFSRELNAEQVELRRQKQRIGVHPVRREQFRTNCDDFGFHVRINRIAEDLLRPSPE